MLDLLDQPAWKRLSLHRERIGNDHLRDLLKRPNRFRNLTFEACDLFVDFSKQRLDEAIIQDLVGLAEARGVLEGRLAMWNGEAINWTENRAVLHVALRQPRSESHVRDSKASAVLRVLERAYDFARSVRNGRWKGADGAAIRDVVNLGIGGSDLGPAMVYRALSELSSGPRIHYVSNVDGHHLHATLKELNPASTLFIVASKTFSTQETLTNAQSARKWVVEWGGEEAVPRHFVAVSTSVDRVRQFGIDASQMFEFWDWVGGRYSLWSAIGLSLMVGLGPEVFAELLEGAAAMDQHFRDSPLDRNLPVLLALVGLWNRNFLGLESMAVLPYDQRLELLPAWLQQLDMESNGKGTNRQGDPVKVDTGPVVWGSPGTNGQHAFYQLLHQSPTIIPSEFLAVLQPDHTLEGHHAKLLANFLAQPEALAIGRTLDEVREDLREQGMSPEAVEALGPHKVFAGNRPSTSIVLRRLDARSLGTLLALYEHKIFVQGLVWGLNSFDQWGVELGKELATRILPEITGSKDPDSGDHDPCTLALIQRVRSMTLR